MFHVKHLYNLIGLPIPIVGPPEFAPVSIRVPLPDGAWSVLKPLARPIVERAEPLRPGETFGAYYYLSDILDQLEQYRDALVVLRRADRDTFALYARIGGQVIGINSRIKRTRDLDGMAMPSEEWLRDKNRPAVAFIHPGFYTTEQPSRSDPSKMATLINARLMYYIEVLPMAEVERPPPGASMFRVGALYTMKKKIERDEIFYSSFYVAVSPEGRVTALRERTGRVHNLPRAKRGYTDSYVETCWRHNRFLRELLDDPECPQPTVHHAAAAIFTMLASVYNGAAFDGFQIIAERAGIAARFNVCLKRTPYFFKDRERVVNQNGRTCRIFHGVEEHERFMRNKVVTVRAHFRGLRKFAWKNHEVTIYTPDPEGKRNWTGAATEHPGRRVPPGWETMRHLGRTIRMVLERTGHRAA